MGPTTNDTPAPLSDSERSILRERLELRRDELQARLAHDQAAATQAESLSEPMDAAEQTREQDDVVLANRDRALLGDIEDALAKFETSDYGVGELSGEPIGFQRLQAVPWARVTADEAEAT